MEGGIGRDRTEQGQTKSFLSLEHIRWNTKPLGRDLEPSPTLYMAEGNMKGEIYLAEDAHVGQVAACPLANLVSDGIGNGLERCSRLKNNQKETKNIIHDPL